MKFIKNQNGMMFTLVAGLTILALTTCCGSDKIVSHNYVIPDQLDDGWAVSSLSAQGINSDNIVEVHSRIHNGEYLGINSLLIVRNGNLVFEEYYYGQTRDAAHPIYSVTKSVSSALIGIAIDEGFLSGVDQTIEELLPEYEYIEWSYKHQITVEDFLTMSSGLDWEELAYPYPDSRNSHWQMTRANEWYEFILERPMMYTHGTHFEYNTGTSNMFARLIDNTTGLPINIFAENHLFGPLGITGVDWYRDPHGNPCAGGSGGGLSIKARDMAKFGYLYLNDGVWGDSQVIPSDWIAESLNRHVSLTSGMGYGYQFWQRQFNYRGQFIDAWYGLGYGGQYIFIIDELDLMVMFTSENYEREYAYSQVIEMMADYILPAVRQ